ncbi:hypothetical protein HQ545_00440 [Candidatus Woesearchaeota archaeon]|nr:hypothetical protein [Candidatus Woesearchaeota archaeon]
MNKNLLLTILLLMLTPMLVSAAGVAVVPDTITLNPTAYFQIVNPNKNTMSFEVKSENTDCTPEKGSIVAGSRMKITCTNLRVEKDIIMVETSMKQSGNLGILPAVAVKARRKEIPEQTKSPPATPFDKSKSEPLSITGTADQGKETNQSREELQKRDNKTEMLTVYVLCCAIITLLIYTEIRKRRKQKCESNKKQNSKKQNKDEQEKSDLFSSVKKINDPAG